MLGESKILSNIVVVASINSFWDQDSCDTYFSIHNSADLDMWVVWIFHFQLIYLLLLMVLLFFVILFLFTHYCNYRDDDASLSSLLLTLIRLNF